MTIVFDAGGLIAIERGDSELWAFATRERLKGRTPLTHGGVIGQVWRGGSHRQATLARFLPGVDVRPIDDDLGRRAGVLLAATGSADVIDAAVVLLARDGDVIITSDPEDLAVLAAAADLHVEIIPV